MHSKKLHLFIFLILMSVFFSSCFKPKAVYQIAPKEGDKREELVASSENIMVAAEGLQASKAGIEIYKKGGNIVDSAIASSFAISVIRPHSTGLGGGGFMMIHLANQHKTIVADFRERAPLRASKDMYLKDGTVIKDKSLNGFAAAGAPGTVAGLVELHKRYGNLPLSEVLKPAILLAEKGFHIDSDIVFAIHHRSKIIKDNPDMKNLFMPGGVALKKGDLLIQTDLAKTLRSIAKHGKDGFYKGWVANAIVSDMKMNGGFVRKKDLLNYKVKYRKPVEGTYRGHRIVSMPPPSSGGVHIIQMLNMLENVRLKKYKLHSIAYAHLLSEVMQRAYADRAKYLGDPDFFDVPVDQLLSKKDAHRLYRSIHPRKATSSSTYNRPKLSMPESKNTVHLTLMDKFGNAVTSTQSINYLFGSGVMVKGTGIILNDTMDDFSVAPGVANAYGLVGAKANEIAAQKTPLSSMTPTIVFKGGKPFLAIGAAGGSYIITAVLNSIINVIDFGLPLDKALAAGRVHHQYLPDLLVYDGETLSPKAIKYLKVMGHKLEKKNIFGRCQAVLWNGKKLIGAADPRSRGKPLGL